MKSLLLICRQAPWSGLAARELLDVALAGGAFDLPLALLFLDDGVLQLAPTQNPKALAQKDVQANLNALPMFGVEALYADSQSLAVRGVNAEALSMDVELLDDAGIKALIAQYDQVITL